MRILIDDLRSFADNRDCVVARSSEEGVKVLGENMLQPIDELWLDHDLGGDDEIWPVITLLETVTFNIGAIYVHTSNPSGAERMMVALSRQGYNVTRWSHSNIWAYHEETIETSSLG